MTAWAGQKARLTERGTKPLARHFKKSETRDPPELNPGPIHADGIPQAVLDGPLVSRSHHVDKVDNKEAAKVSKSQLASDLIGSFEVGVERRFLDIAAFGGAGRVDINGGERF